MEGGDRRPRTLADTPRASRRRRAPQVQRNLPDGVQQQLIAIRILTGLAAEEAPVDGAIRASLSMIDDNVQDALEEVRAVSHGLYPPLLSAKRLVVALRAIQRRTPLPLSLHTDGVERYSPDVESAVYYSCLEAIQNGLGGCLTVRSAPGQGTLLSGRVPRSTRTNA